MTVGHDRRAPARRGPGSLARALGHGLVAAAACGLVLFVCAAILAFSAGLLVVALFLGRVVGLSLRSGGGGLSPAVRAGWATLLSLVAVTVALLATWSFSRASGGVLGPIDYLAETLGAIVPLLYLLAAPAAWWGSR